MTNEPLFDLFSFTRRGRDDRLSLTAGRSRRSAVLVGDSDLLRNPADDHSKIVFDPAIHMKTDQFILKFRKP